MTCKHCKKEIPDRNTAPICDACFAREVWMKEEGKP